MSNSDGALALSALILIAIGLFMIGFLCGYGVGIDDGKQMIRIEAVKHGAAHYDPKTAAFVWNTTEQHP